MKHHSDSYDMPTIRQHILIFTKLEMLITFSLFNSSLLRKMRVPSLVYQLEIENSNAQVLMLHNQAMSNTVKS